MFPLKIVMEDLCQPLGGGSSGGGSINIFSFEDISSLNWTYSVNGGIANNAGYSGTGRTGRSGRKGNGNQRKD